MLVPPNDTVSANAKYLSNQLELLKEEEAIDAEVRKKISSQKKEIVEGSEEWDVVYRKYYAEEMRRLGVVHVSSNSQ